ncbi:U7 snRNA-associated Sm-like protein LSm10 [Mytilus edulis]|uniref:U7 snRNA-associated Sm-like protein LSm10 n=1 Tax=Mytilus edulis TaxID=6550 RepID=UPI0039F057D2
MASNRQKFLIKNSLISLLKALEGKVTTVELRNEHTVTGTIDYVDGFMCVSMSNVCFKTLSGKMTNFEQFYIQGPNIRFVQIPDEIDMKKAIHWEVNEERIMRQRMQKAISDAVIKKRQKREKEITKKEEKEQKLLKEAVDKKDAPN